jgi:hypothetical protein
MDRDGGEEAHRAAGLAAAAGDGLPVSACLQIRTSPVLGAQSPPQSKVIPTSQIWEASHENDQIFPASRSRGAT